MSEEGVIQAAMALARRMRVDPVARTAVHGILAERGCETVAELAGKDPELVAGLVEMFVDMDAGDEAIDSWLRSWKPANLDML